MTNDARRDGDAYIRAGDEQRLARVSRYLKRAGGPQAFADAVVRAGSPALADEFLAAWNGFGLASEALNQTVERQRASTMPSEEASFAACVTRAYARVQLTAARDAADVAEEDLQHAFERARAWLKSVLCSS